MHVFVATGAARMRHLDGDAASLEGELVHLPAGVCDRCRAGDACGWCEDAFTGVASHRPAPVAEVVDRDLTGSLVVEAVAHSLLDANLFWGANDAALRATDLAYSLVAGLLDAAGGLPVGTIVERSAGRLLVRSRT